MEIIENLDKKSNGECVIALGFFDGVHLGHRELLCKAKQIAAESGISFGIFTFKSSDKIKQGTKRIYSDKEKTEIFAELGADFAVFADFSLLSGLSAEEFVKNILVAKLNAKIAVAGYNYRFGKGALGNADTLSTLMAENGRAAVICEEFRLEGKPISTTIIKTALEDGEIELASKMLGTPYTISGTVCHGRGEGRLLGFPTINTESGSSKLLPKNGVYQTEVKIGTESYKALTNVGTCPTFQARDPHLETYLLNFTGNLYSQEVTIKFVRFLREEKQFLSAEELIMQINIDKNAVLSNTNKKSEI